MQAAGQVKVCAVVEAVAAEEFLERGAGVFDGWVLLVDGSAAEDIVIVVVASGIAAAGVDQCVMVRSAYAVYAVSAEF